MNSDHYLSILDDFKCLEGRCPDDCCHGWNLHIDAQTLTNWKNYNDTELRSSLLNSVSMMVEAGKGVEVVKQGEDGRCMHLSQQGLCSIQEHCGHDFLPETCREYPRVEINHSNDHFRTAHLSCPGIIQLLVKQNTGQRLFKVDNNTGIEVSENTNSLFDSQNYLEQTIHNIISETNYALSNRLYIIASVIEQYHIQIMQNQQDVRKISKTVQLNTKAVQKTCGELHKKLKNNKLKINKKISGLYWQFVISHCRTLADPVVIALINNSKTFKNIQALKAVNDNTDKFYLKHFQLMSTLISALPVKAQNQIDQLLMPYLQVKFRNHGLPRNLYKNNIILTFLDCVIPYTQIIMILGLIYESKRIITEADVVTVIYKVEKKIAHNTAILDALEQREELFQLMQYSGSWL